MQVGELYASCHGNKAHAGRQSLEFHLNARPSALINFHDILEEAGHFVPDRYVLMQEAKHQGSCSDGKLGSYGTVTSLCSD